MSKLLVSCGRRVAVVAAVLALSASGVLAQATRAQQEEACAPDAVRLCAATIPDVAKTTACMRSHISDLGPSCRAIFTAAAGGGPTRAAAAKPVVAPVKPAARQAATPTRRDARAARPIPSRVKTVRDNRPMVRAAALPTRRVLQAAPPPNATYAPVVVAQPVPPAYPSPTPGFDGFAASIAQSCRDGLIDAFTCRNTFDALHLGQ